jgi:hypothetical protein
MIAADYGGNSGDSAHADALLALIATTNFLGKSFVLKKRLQRKDFRNMTRLAWAQEVPSSNLGAPITNLTY